MSKFSTSILFLFILVLGACGSNKESYYSLEKKYWDSEDYRLASVQLEHDNIDEKELPNLDNPATTPIFLKIVDTSNITVVATDEQLGLAHRTDFTDKMFDHYKNISNAYSLTDRTDKYKYPKELVEVMKFGLCLQLYYILTNNGKILKEADSPEEPEVVRVINSNQNVLVGNYNLYLDYINREDQFTEEALSRYASGIDTYFPRLLSTSPNADYSEMIEKVNNMVKKTNNPQIKASLEKLSLMLSPAKQE